MKVFVAGATGVVGRRAVKGLVAAGHEVTAVARSEEKAALVRSLGATPVRLDLFDPAAVEDAAVGHDAVVNLTTHVPRAAASALPGAWNESDRLRTEVSRNLVDAANAAGATRYVQESITFSYRDGGDAWLDEDAAVEGDTYAAVFDAERNATTFAGTAVVLRFGAFYDEESHTTRDMLRLAALGRFGLPGAPDAFMSAVHTDDAGAAVLAALDAPAGTYNVVDDEPLRRTEVAEVLTGALGRPVKLLPKLALKAVGSKVAPLARSQRVSNARFKAATSWTPSVPSMRKGFPEVAGKLGYDASAAAARGSTLARVLLALLIPATVVTGLWGAFAPQSFYDDFPGLGRVWVAGDGPFNEHLVRDFGATNLAIAILLVVAVWKGTRVLLATAAAAYTIYAVPHLVYHLRHTEVLDGTDEVTSLVALTIAAVTGVVALVAASIHRRDMTR